MITKKRILALLLATTISVSMVLSGCTKAAGSAYPGTSEKGAVTANIQTEPPKLNSIITTDTVSMNVLRHCMVGLTTLDKQDKPVKGVAKDWTISDDKLTYTFMLRDDFKWSNGEPVTAKDFEFAFKRLVDPTTAAPYSSLAWCIVNGRDITNGEKDVSELGVKVIDDHKLEVTLNQPTPYFLAMMAFVVFYPVNEKAYNEFGGSDGTEYATEADKIATNGAYNLDEWTHTSEIVLTKNADYPMAKDIKIDKINFKMINDPNTALNSFKSNEIDLIEVTGDQSTQLRNEGMEVGSFDDGGSWYFEFNLNDSILKNEKVRKALTYSIDSETFIKNVVKDSSIPAQQFTTRVINGFEKKFYEEVGPQFKDNDEETAKKLLDEASKELGIEIADMKLSFVTGDTPSAKKYAAYFQEQWKTKLGLEVNVEPLPHKARLARMENKDFQIVLGGWGPDYNDPMTFLDMFETGNGNNHSSYSDPEYDALLEKVRVETDNKTRFGYLMDLEKKLMDDMPVGPVYFRAKDYIVSGKLEGVVKTAFQDLNLLWASVK